MKPVRHARPYRDIRRELIRDAAAFLVLIAIICTLPIWAPVP